MLWPSHFLKSIFNIVPALQEMLDHNFRSPIQKWISIVAPIVPKLIEIHAT